MTTGLDVTVSDADSLTVALKAPANVTGHGGVTLSGWGGAA
ncbi:hypothetical protein SAMN04487916_10442 [Arthrobacter sp. ov407]|nr:hypothetical protein [Arthrobacter sp. ov407]SDK90524.1 hypothetical protein SAMN04487916_10442 [Arthrobacter sp. ov407]